MKFGIREAVDVVFKVANEDGMLFGGVLLPQGAPVLYFDTLKTATTEGTATTVYAQGGAGNPRLIAWEGDKTITFTFEDALISPEGMALLTGAGLTVPTTSGTADVQRTLTATALVVDGGVGDDYVSYNFTTAIGSNTLVGNITGIVEDADGVAGSVVSGKTYKFITTETVGTTVDVTFVYTLTEPVAATTIRSHKKTVVTGVVSSGVVTVNLTTAVGSNTLVATDVFGFLVDANGDITERLALTSAANKAAVTFTTEANDGNVSVLVDFYVSVASGVKEITIEANQFAGYFYIEGETLFRRQSDGADLPAQIIIPNAKVQTAFTFAMSPSGDPSTFTFTADAFPGVIKGSPTTDKVLYAIQLFE